MVEHTKSLSTHSHNSSDSSSVSDRYTKTRSKHKHIDTNDPSESKNTGSSSVSRDDHDHTSKSKKESLSVIDFDPSFVSVDFYCNYCNQSLSVGCCRIRCAECLDYDLCISCARTYKYTEPHELSHNYAPIGPNSFELFSEGWTADEELMLLEGISKYGFGNWKQVAEMVNKVSNKLKSQTDCESHYYDVYISSNTSPYPNVKNLRTPIKCNKTRDSIYKHFDQIMKTHKKIENPDPEDTIVSSETTGSHSTYIPSPINLLHTDPNKVKFFQNLTGYNIYRDELENEYNPDAEMMLKDIEFENWDSPSEVQFKIQLIDLYNGFLDERIYRKRILMHRFWNDYLIRENAMQNMTDLEKMLYWRLSPLLRFHSEEDHIKLTKLLIAKIELEKRLEIVQHWNSLGLKTIKDVQDFDSTKLNLRSGTNRHGSYFNKIPNISNKIIRNGIIHKDELSEFMNEINEKFCNDFYIRKSHLDDILTAVLNTENNLDFNNINNNNMDNTNNSNKYNNSNNNNNIYNINDNTDHNQLTHLWDVYFDDFNLEENNLYPNIIKPINYLNIPENTNLRIILDPDKDEHDLSDINLEDIKFGNPKYNSQQSNIFTHKDSLIYLTKFTHERYSRVQRNLQKPKRDLQYYSNKRRLSQRR